MQARDQGKNNKQIYESLGIAPDIFYRLVEEWGVKGYQPNQKQSKELACTGTNLTIAQAITMQGDLEADIDVLRYILDVAKNDMTPRVEKLLADALESSREQLERINKAFHATEIAI